MMLEKGRHWSSFFCFGSGYEGNNVTILCFYLCLCFCLSCVFLNVSSLPSIYCDLEVVFPTIILLPSLSPFFLSFPLPSFLPLVWATRVAPLRDSVYRTLASPRQIFCCSLFFLNPRCFPSHICFYLPSSHLPVSLW